MPESAMLDTSVTLRFLVDHGDSDQQGADSLRTAVDRGTTRAQILDLCVYEMINVMARSWKLDDETLGSTITEFLDLDIALVSLEPALALRAADVAVRSGLSGYDAAHVAAAQMVGVPLVTADDRIVTAVPATGLSLRSLGG